ncbi:MAG: acyl-CoA dehydrogenase family protein, partial [Gammaproteobacteria bacterium]|nr:acyl-CoA dehydrogenase family protein [Gammaproteobacteria bacterium]
MDFVITEDARIIEDQVVRFLNEKIIPVEGVYAEQAKTIENGADHEVMVELRAEAKSLGLWNLFLPDEKWGAGLS